MALRLEETLNKLKAFLRLCLLLRRRSIYRTRNVLEDDQTARNLERDSSSRYESCEEFEDDVDHRAEIFIENFRRQLRLERQISLQLRLYGVNNNSFETDYEEILPPPPPPPPIVWMNFLLKLNRSAVENFERDFLICVWFCLLMKVNYELVVCWCHFNFIRFVIVDLSKILFVFIWIWIRVNLLLMDWICFCLILYLFISNVLAIAFNLVF